MSGLKERVREEDYQRSETTLVIYEVYGVDRHGDRYFLKKYFSKTEAENYAEGQVSRVSCAVTGIFSTYIQELSYAWHEGERKNPYKVCFTDKENDLTGGNDSMIYDHDNPKG